MSRDYPRMMFHRKHEPVTVLSEEEESALGPGWTRTIPQAQEPEPDEENEPDEEPEEEEFPPELPEEQPEEKRPKRQPAHAKPHAPEPPPPRKRLFGRRKT